MYIHIKQIRQLHFWKKQKLLLNVEWKENKKSIIKVDTKRYVAPGLVAVDQGTGDNQLLNNIIFRMWKHNNNKF